MEALAIDGGMHMSLGLRADFWSGKRVFLTGHTGFKGSWASLWLQSMGAIVTGYSLEPPTSPNLFELAKVGEGMRSIHGDIRDLNSLSKELLSAEPELVFHMAAQPLVRQSYKNPLETYETNVMGTANLLEAIRSCSSVKSVVVITTDKCYENKEWVWGYREGEPLGGYDPYSSSKACAEILTSAYRRSFFHPADYDRHGVAIATARAGNVIGGGDWASDRLIPDCIRSLLSGEKITIRSPYAIRPWQHVLESLSGYFLLSERLYLDGQPYGEAWNFGPPDEDAKPVEWIVENLCNKWGGSAGYVIATDPQPHEANYLKLDSSKARRELEWGSTWSLDRALDAIVEWTRAYRERQDLRLVCLQQIATYSGM